MAAASHHYEVKLVGVWMKVWLEYTAGRRKKAELKRMAVQAHNSALLLQFFTKWKGQFLESRRIAEFKDLIMSRSRLAICRRTFCHWKFCILQLTTVSIQC